MNGKSTSNKNSPKALPVETAETMLSKYSTDLDSYSLACHDEDDLKSFNSSIIQGTSKFMRSLSAHTPTDESVPLYSLIDFYGCLYELQQEAMNAITKNREDVWKNKDLKSLVDVYFKNTSKTLDFCNTVDGCVKKTENGQLIIRLAVKHFERESVKTNAGENSKKKKYGKTLEQLNKFKAIPFSEGEFEAQCMSVYDEQVLLLEDLRKLREKLDKDKRNAKIWRILSNIVFITTFASVFVLSVVLTAIGAPALVTAVGAAVASGTSGPIIDAGKWLNEKWKEYEKAVKRQKALLSEVDKATILNKIEMGNVKAEVDSLRIKIWSLQGTVEVAVGINEDEEEIKMAIETIMKDVDEFTKKIMEVGDSTAKYRSNIMKGRYDVLKHIRQLPAN